MKTTIYGENRYPDPHLFVLYAVEEVGATELFEIFRQCLPYMPRYERGDVIKFSIVDEPGHNQMRYIVDRVVHYVICMNNPPEGQNVPPHQNQIYVILKPQQLAPGSELLVSKLKGQYDLSLYEDK